MADSTVADLSKMKVVELRKELKTRGLTHTGDKAELVARLQAAMQQESNDEHADINLDSDEIDSDGVLDEDDKSQHDFDDTGVSLSEDLVLADADQPPSPAPKPAPDRAPTTVPEPKQRTLKRKIVAPDNSDKAENKDQGTKKIVLHRSISAPKSDSDTPKTETVDAKADAKEESNKVKITADADPKTKMEMRAKRFGLPVKMSDDERKELRKQRFGVSAGVTKTTSVLGEGTLTENIDKLKLRAERFGQSVSKIMTDIENKEKLEKRKAKFGVK